MYVCIYLYIYIYKYNFFRLALNTIKNAINIIFKAGLIQRNAMQICIYYIKHT
jgi:hypothetical protein